MISVPTSEFNSIVTSVADGTQPSTTYGTSVTPGTSNAYGSYTSVLSGASLTADAYMLEVVVNGTFANATDRGMLVTVGFDPAGGTSFGGLGGVTGNEISHLLCSGASLWYANGSPQAGQRFMFPLFVKAGTSIGAKAQTNSGTAGTIRVAVNLWCQPKRPDAVRAGSFVRTIGATTATTDGTSITCGTASEGAWTSLGSVSDSLWYMEIGMGARSAAQVDALVHGDVSVGDASNKRTVMRDLYCLCSASEQSSKIGRTGAYVDLKSGDTIYARGQGSAAPNGFSMAAYCVGG